MNLYTDHTEGRMLGGPVLLARHIPAVAQFCSPAANLRNIFAGRYWFAAAGGCADWRNLVVTMPYMLDAL